MGPRHALLKTSTDWILVKKYRLVNQSLVPAQF